MKIKYITEQGKEYQVRTEYYENGKISYEGWYFKGQRHREGDSPACISYYKNGKIKSQEWFLNGQLHRTGGNPAYITYYFDGKINSQEWYLNGQHHREDDKPAYISYYPDGKIRSQQWYLYGVRVTKKFIKNKEWEKLSINDILSESNVQKRMMLIKLVGIDKIVKEGNYKVLEEIKGTDLYKKYPIGDYYQQGDVLVKPNPINQVSFDDIDEKTKVRLSKITYKLIQIDKFKYLQMNNPSHNDLIHIEGVADNIDGVFEAICFRNKVNYLPMALA